MSHMVNGDLNVFIDRGSRATRIGCEKMGQTMKHNFSLSLISSILLCAAAPTLVAQGGTAEPLSCADHSITARAVRFPGRR